MGSNTKRCEICGREYTNTAPHMKYCCILCREMARSRKATSWRKQHPEYSKAYMKRYRREKKGGRIVLGVCAHKEKETCRGCEYSHAPRLADGGCKLLDSPQAGVEVNKR